MLPAAAKAALCVVPGIKNKYRLGKAAALYLLKQFVDPSQRYAVPYEDTYSKPARQLRRCLKRRRTGSWNDGVGVTHYFDKNFGKIWRCMHRSGITQFCGSYSNRVL